MHDRQDGGAGGGLHSPGRAGNAPDAALDFWRITPIPPETLMRVLLQALRLTNAHDL
jgi:hypothetical protein